MEDNEAIEETPLIHKTINKIAFLYSYMGINVAILKRTPKEKFTNRLVYIFNRIWFNTDLGGAIAWFFTGIAQHKSFTELTYVSPCITFSFLGNMKSLYLNIYEEEADNLIEILKKFEMAERGKPKNDEKDEIIMSEHNFVTRVLRLLNIMYFVLIIAFAVSPLCLVALRYYSTGVVQLELPFLILYPFDSFDIHYWPWVYLHQIWSEIIVVGDNCAVDYLFYILCTYIRTQFLLLKYYLENLIPPGATSENLNKEEIKEKLNKLVKTHQEIISCVDVLEKVYTKSMLQNFVSSSILICLTGFNVMAITDIFIVMTFLSFLFMSLLQIFFLCFFGDLMMAASMEVSAAAYNCRWYLADPSIAKYILLIQTRSQTPCRLTAYNFYEVNLKAFMKILSTAWSYFALLQTLYGGPTE